MECLEENARKAKQKGSPIQETPERKANGNLNPLRSHKIANKTKTSFNKQQLWHKKNLILKAKLDAKAIIEELKTPGLIILGMVGGNMAGKLIDKAVKVDDTATGFQAKALIKPVIQISAGVGGALFLKDKNLKLICSGVAASGIASTVKVFLKKDILQGLTNFAGLG